MANHTIITGLRANGDLHIGNYFGAMQPMVDLQQRLETSDRLLMFVPDLHSITTPTAYEELQKNILANIRMYIAAGLDPDHANTVLFRQSFVPAHAELSWILSCFTYFGEASRMTEFKDKSERLGHKAVSVGLFSYPILMSADILLYGADYIPLGDDQKQHMELTRTLAERLNHTFNTELVKVPKSWQEQLEFAGRDNSVRIKSLSNPEAKMSKSVSDPKGTIALFDNPDEAAAKVMSAVTDSDGNIQFDLANRPGISNLLQLLALFSGRHLEEVASEWSGQSSYGELKQAVADAVKQFLNDFQTRYNETSDEQAEAILKAGEVEANKAANETLARVQRAVGFRP